ncbi:MAG: ROK family protein [Gemmobacter sp.]|nr:ROK family protein [Gemmobacter sp.]
MAISIAGCIDPGTGRMRIANIPCLDGRVLVADLEAALGLPVWIGNDADCFALAEAGSGAGQGHRTVFGVILGTGVGGGLVIDGRLVTGAGGFAGEWGHGPVQDSRPLGRVLPRLTCGCGQVGCLDPIGSARGIERLHAHLHGVALGSEAIIAHWQAGMAAASETVAIWLEVMAGPLAMVLNVVGATVVPVGGGLGRARPLVAALDGAVAARRLWQAPGPVVVPAALQGEPGLIGASHGGWASLNLGVGPC